MYESMAIDGLLLTYCDTAKRLLNAPDKDYFMKQLDRLIVVRKHIERRLEIC